MRSSSKGRSASDRFRRVEDLVAIFGQFIDFSLEGIDLALIPPVLRLGLAHMEFAKAPVEIQQQRAFFRPQHFRPPVAVCPLLGLRKR